MSLLLPVEVSRLKMCGYMTLGLKKKQKKNRFVKVEHVCCAVRKWGELYCTVSKIWVQCEFCSLD